MADGMDSEQVKNQVYMNNRQFQDLYYDYERGYIKATQNQYALLLSAKACFLKQKYSDCIGVLNRVKLDYNTKILYQKQALLLKVTYLTDPENINALQNIVRQYDRYKTRCPGKPLSDFHHNSIRQLLQYPIKAKQYRLRAENVDRQQLKIKIKQLQKRKKYQGMPSYLVSSSWNKKFNDYLLRGGSNPGPITNFQIINHVFELLPHEQPSKQYMDKLLFPMIQQKHYFTLSSRHWKILQQTFGGNPVKRIFTYNFKNRQIQGGDHLIKTVIQHMNERVVMQWQEGTYWEKSVLPLLSTKFGFGQLKQQTRNKDFLIVQPGRVQQPTTRLKYVFVNINKIKAVTQNQQQIKKKMLATFDMEKYNPDQCPPRGTVGLANLGNTCYMSSGIQFLANLKMLTSYFLQNRYLPKLNLGQNNKDGSHGIITCGYADIVKRLWFSHRDTRYIDPTLFKRAFGQRYSMFDGYDQQDAQQFLMFILNCLHQDLNQNSQMNLAHRESMTGKAFDSVLTSAVNHYNKHNKSIISDLFHGFSYEEIKCDKCSFTTYKFQHNLMLHLQVPPEAPKLIVYFVQTNNYAEAKKVQIYIKNLQTLRQIFDIIRKYFQISAESQLYPFLYSDDPKEWQDLNGDDGINYVCKKQAKGLFLFIYQVKKPQADEQIAMITYFYDSKIKGLQCDGFPRILVVKKTFKEKQFQQQLQDLVLSTIPKSKIQRDRKQYVNQIKFKKTTNKYYAIEYKAFFNLKVSNFSNIQTNKVLGDAEIQGTINLDGVLQKMRKKEIIDQTQNWYCQRCRCARQAHKTDKIYSVGKYLIIQFKRFTQNGKITTKIDYPIDNLNMKPYVQAEKGRFDIFLYNLQGVILHRGSLNSGHYTCLCRVNKNQWLNYDDQSVRPIDESLVVDYNAYILVYERADESTSYVSMNNINN